MTVSKRNNPFAIFLIFLLTVFGLISCGSGSGSGSGSAQTPGTGSVAILFTDMPTSDFSEINLAVTRIELLSDDARVTVFSGNKTLNLLDLKNETTLFSVEDGIPADLYEKIRLTVNRVELIDNEGQAVTKPVKLPGNGKVDLNPRHPFLVSPGEVLAIQLDLDAEKSIKLHENKKKYIFRPVVFINIIEGLSRDKLIRAAGFVDDIDQAGMTFRLCPDNSNSSFNSASIGHNRCCIDVHVSDTTSFFSSDDQGNEVGFSDLRDGDSATVIGSYRAFSSEDAGGTCSVELNAVVVETGRFLKLTGTILSSIDPASGQFEFQIDPNQEVESAAPIRVQLQDGTKVYSAEGEMLDESAIVENRKAEIDGILLLNASPDILNAAFISIDTESVSASRISGEIDGINRIARTFDLITPSESVCVEVADNADIFLITDDEQLESRMIPFTDLITGAQVDLYGSYSTSSECFIAETVISYDSAAEPEILVTYDASEWEAMVSETEVFTTTAENIALAEEVTSVPELNAQLGPVLTFQAVNSGLSRDFEVRTLQPGAGFTFSDTESGTPLLGFENALSVGDTDDFEDDDWQLNLLGGDTMRAFGVELRHSAFGPDEMITLYSGGDPVGTVHLGSLPGTGNDTYFIGIVADIPFDAVGFDEDPDGDDIAIADFRFGSVVP